VNEVVDALGSLITRHRASPIEPSEMRECLEASLERVITAEQSTGASIASCSDADQLIGSLRVPELRAHLKQLGLPTAGRKAELCQRLCNAMSECPARLELDSSAEISRDEPDGAANTADVSVKDPQLQRRLNGVLGKFAGQGPQTGIFCDGGCAPTNPGPGGWGFVHVCDGRIVTEKQGNSRMETTNNRMEMTAIIEALRHIGEHDRITLYSDSNLCVRTLTEWATVWESQGWRRGRAKSPVENLDLVQEAYSLKQSRPLVEIRWVKGHSGNLWNEYADCLATWRP